MIHPGGTIVRSVLNKRLTVILLLAGFAIGAFATLGDGKLKSNSSKKVSLLSDKSATSRGSFNLKSGYSFHGIQVINTQNQRNISLNTTFTYQQGHTTYTVPLKRKLVSDRITFNPNAATRH